MKNTTVSYMSDVFMLRRIGVMLGLLFLVIISYAPFSTTLTAEQRSNNYHLAIILFIIGPGLILLGEYIKKTAPVRIVKKAQRKENVRVINAWVDKMESGTDPILGCYKEGIRVTKNELISYRIASQELIDDGNASKMIIILTTLIRIAEARGSKSWQMVLYNLLSRVDEF